MAASGVAGTAAGPAQVFSLLRSILRLHRARLPPPMRDMGNNLVLSEFRRHLQNSNTTDAQWRTFYVEWQRYSAMLGGTADLQAAPASQSSPAAAGGPSTHGQQGGGAQASVTGAIASSSGDLTEELLEQLSPDQRRRLVKLQQEAAALGRSMLGKADTGGDPGGS